MPTFDTTQPTETTSEWTPLETGTYPMRIAEAQIAKSKFADDRGDFRDELTLVWELTKPHRPEWTEAGYSEGQRVFQRMAPFYGSTKAGIDSRFKQFIDRLLKVGLIKSNFWIAGEGDAPNQGDLVGITMNVMVEQYIKTQGANAGQPGNKVLATALIDGKPQPQTPAPPIAERTKPNLADADDIVPKGGYATTKPSADDMSTPDLRAYAKTLAPNAGRWWAKETDWDDVSRGTLIDRIARMERAIESGQLDDTEPPLF